jgi:hypothetical protein
VYLSSRCQSCRQPLYEIDIFISLMKMFNICLDKVPSILEMYEEMATRLNTQGRIL